LFLRFGSVLLMLKHITDRVAEVLDQDEQGACARIVSILANVYAFAYGFTATSRSAYTITTVVGETVTWVLHNPHTGETWEQETRNRRSAYFRARLFRGQLAVFVY
jgi:hypothetical protein